MPMSKDTPAAENAATPQEPPAYEPENEHASYFAPRVRDFEPNSCGTSIREPDTESLLPTYAAAARPWGRYRSEEAYLDALRKFVSEREHVDGPTDANGKPIGLIGFYGSKTGSDYASGPGLGAGRKNKSRKPSRGGGNTQGEQATAACETDDEDQNTTKKGFKHWLRKIRSN